MDLEQIKDLIHHFEGSKLKKLVLKREDVELQLEKEEPHFSTPKSLPERSHHFEAVAPSPVKEGKREEASGSFVVSPMVGTFYSSPAPDQPSFVKVGDAVSEETIVCIVEAMKVMNEVKAGVSGIVVEILVENSQPVEFGSRLMRVR